MEKNTSKKIQITGKRNIDSFSNNKEKSRKSFLDYESKKDNNTDLILNKSKQIEILNKLYLGECYVGYQYVEKEIKKKISAYKRQDISKKRYNKETLITYDECVEKLVLSKLKCNYCLCDCILVYKNVREKKQWTLDRIDNDMDHSKKNTVICCLECNLKKRTTNDNAFRFAKQVNIIKGF